MKWTESQSERIGRAVCPRALPMSLQYVEDVAVGIMQYYEPAAFTAEDDFLRYAQELIQVRERHD